MNDTQLLEKQAEIYRLLPADQRAVIRKEAQNLAFGNYPAKTVEFNRQVLQKIQQVEISLQQAAKPAPPTAKETRAFFVWIAGILGGCAALVGGLWLVGAMVVGIGEAIRIWAVANAVVIGWVVASFLAVLGISALPKWKGESETTPPEKGGDQTIIVNVFTSQNGNVNVKTGE